MRTRTWTVAAAAAFLTAWVIPAPAAMAQAAPGVGANPSNPPQAIDQMRAIRQMRALEDALRAAGIRVTASGVPAGLDSARAPQAELIRTPQFTILPDSIDAADRAVIQAWRLSLSASVFRANRVVSENLWSRWIANNASNQVTTAAFNIQSSSVRQAPQEAKREVMEDFARQCPIEAAKLNNAAIVAYFYDDAVSAISDGGDGRRQMHDQRLRGHGITGDDDRAPLCAYRELLDVARTVIALKLSGARFCSGFLVAPDLVLTAAHCLTAARGQTVSGNYFLPESQLRELTVEIGAMGPPLTSAGERAVTGVLWPVGDDNRKSIAEGLYGPELADVALLSIESDPDAPAAAIRLCRTASAAERQGEPYVVMGFPDRQPRIMENVRGILPFQVAPTTRNELFCRLAGPIWNAVRNSEPAWSADAGLRGRILERVKDILAQIDKAYVPLKGGGGEFTLLHRGYSRGVGMPAFVIDPDARGGASGGLVVHRRLFCAAGVYVAGPTAAQVQEANWFEHHVAVPAEVALQQLEAHGRNDAALAAAVSRIRSHQAELTNLYRRRTQDPADRCE